MEPGSTVSAVRSSRVLCGTEIRPALIVIKEGKIHKILPDSSGSTGDTAAGSEVGIDWLSGFCSIWYFICIYFFVLIMTLFVQNVCVIISYEEKHFPVQLVLTV